MADRINVAIVITRLDLGGAQKVALYLAKYSDKKKFNVHLIAGSGGYLDKEAITQKNGAVYQLWPEIKHPIRPINDFKAVLKLKKYFVENKIDIVHTHSSKAGIIGRLAARLAGVKRVIHTIHGFSFHEHQNPVVFSLYRLLEIFFSAFTDNFIAVGEDMVDYGVTEGIGWRGKYTVIRAGVELEKFKKASSGYKKARKKFGVKPGQFLVGMIGNLKKQKNPLAFVKIAKIAAEKNPSIVFKFAGDGPLRLKTEKMITRFGLQDKIQLMGWIDNPEEFMAACDMFLLTSLWEGLPCTLAQAAAAGKICAASDIYGNREMIKGLGAGYLFKPEDFKAAASYIYEESKSGKKPVYGSQAAKYLSQFDADIMVKQHEKLYLIR